MMAEGTYELHPGDALYPEIVLELSDVPQTLYVRGNPEVLSTPAVSIIGARQGLAVWSCRGRACGKGGGRGGSDGSFGRRGRL